MSDYNPTAAVEEIRTKLSIAASKPQTRLISGLMQEVALLDSHLSDGGRMPVQWHRRRLGRKPITVDGEISQTLTHSQHGTRGGYNTGCRCMPCRAANRGEDPEVIRELKEERGWA